MSVYVWVFIAGAFVTLIAINSVLLRLYLTLRAERETPSPEAIKLKRRIAKLPASALPMWTEQVLGETGRAFSMWRASGERVHLDEARTGAYALHSLFTSMQPHE